MKIKKAIIVALFLCLFMISAVSATTDTDDTVSSDATNEKISHTDTTNRDISSPNENVLKKTNTNADIEDGLKKNELHNTSKKAVTDDKNLLKDSTHITVNNWTMLELEIHYDHENISLEGSDNNYIAKYEIRINPRRNVTINGNGHTINGVGETSIFTVAEHAELILENLKLINAKGEAIFNLCNLTLINCTFINNNAVNYGGAIKNLGKLTIINCIFTKNTGGNSGGAICNNGTLIVKNTIFDKNSAKLGTAIYATDGNNITVHNCKFYDNDVFCASGNVDLTDSQFSKTTSTSTKSKNVGLVVSAPSVINTFKKSQKFKVLVKDNGKVVKNAKVNIKVYTGKKYKNYNLKTNSKGIVSINTKKLGKGKHNVIINVVTEKCKVTKKSTIEISSGYHTFKWRKYKIRITDSQYKKIKKATHGSTYAITRNTGDYKKYKFRVYKTKKIKKYGYVYKYKLASKVTLYESWSYSSAYTTPKGYVFAGTKTEVYGDYNYYSYVKYRSKNKVTYYKKVKVKAYKTKKTPIKICVGADEMNGAYLNVYCEYHDGFELHIKDYVFKELKI